MKTPNHEIQQDPAEGSREVIERALGERPEAPSTEKSVPPHALQPDPPEGRRDVEN